MLTLTVLLTLLTGCGNTAEGTSESMSEAAASEETDVAEAPTATDVEASAASDSAVDFAAKVPEVTISYPPEGDALELSLFTSFPGNLTSYMQAAIKPRDIPPTPGCLPVISSRWTAR